MSNVWEDAVTAANRLMHGDYPPDITLNEMRELFEEDAQLLAGVVLSIEDEPKWASEFRTGRVWARLPE